MRGRSPAIRGNRGQPLFNQPEPASGGPEEVEVQWNVYNQAWFDKYTPSISYFVAET